MPNKKSTPNKKTNPNKAILEEFFQKAMLFLREPVRAFDQEKKTDVRQGFLYMAVLSIVVAVLSGVVAAASFPAAWSGVFVSIILGYFGGLLFAVITGLWLHLWAYIFGAKKGLHNTLKTVFYAGTPTYLLGWVPWIGFLFSLWSIYLDWIGLQRLQSMKPDRSAIIVVIAIVIPTILAIAAAIFVMSLLTQMPGYGMLPPGMDMPS